MSTLRLYFLGLLDICYDDQPLPKPATLKSQSLLAYLILHRHRPQPRDRLVGLFWSDRPEHKARSSLSTALWHIRRCLPTDCILSDPHAVQFDPHADLWLDIDEFGSHLSQDDMQHLQAAVALYRGDFLDGFYDDWIINERYRLETLFSEALARLMVAQEARREHDTALTTALRLLDCDPLREDAHRLAMRAYCQLGQRNAALGQYRRCYEVMREELGAEPMVETTELYQAILEGRFAVGRAPGALPVQIPAIPAGRSPLDVIALSSLVGREPEMASLHECWQRMEAEGGGLVLISGEAGVGKTRLVEEFANRLRWQGVRVLWGRCYEFERVLPYQPVAEALRTILPTLTPAELAEFPAWILGEVARLVPEVLEKLVLSHPSTSSGHGVEGRPDPETPASIRPDQEQARLFDGVARFLAELSAHGALLVILDDLHWASESTLQLIHYLVRHLAEHLVLMVGTFHLEAVGQEHPLQALQQQLSREVGANDHSPLLKPLHLARLSPEAVQKMVVEMSGAGGAVAPLAERLYRETEGNPFFLMEITKALFETGVVRLEGGAWEGDFVRISEGELPLPAGVSETIQVRVRGLNEDAQEALRLAAVLGREFDFGLLNAVWDRGEEATLEALDDLLRHRLVDEGSGAMGRDYAFTHHKIQEVVYAVMPRRRRQHAHARVGAAMEHLYGPHAEALAGELAYHFEQGRELDKTLTEKAITYLLKAGDRARGLYAHQEAIDYYQRALALLKEQREHERAARTLMKLGLTYHTAFDFQRARQAYDEGFAVWQRAGKMESTAPPPASYTLRVAWRDLPSLDPAMSGDNWSVGVIDQLFSGLVELTPEMDVVPEAARTWEVLEGGRKYVFHLRDDVRWSDGALVTAGDFEYAWKRVLDPVTGSPLASLLYDVKGAKAFHRGEGGRGDVGVRALDEVTLVVELEGPTGYFLHLLAFIYPVPRHVVEAHGGAWTEIENIVTSGPFRLEAWQRGQSMILSRNLEYCGRFTGNVQWVQLSLFPEVSAQFEIYEAGDLDFFYLWALSSREMDRTRQRHAGEYVSLPELSTLYVGFDASRPPFDDPRVRWAFALATDRETLADVAMRGYVAPAIGGFIPPGMPGHSVGIGLPYDPDRARQLLVEAGYPGGRGFPVVDALVPRGNLVPYSEYLQAQWRENLGVEITWEAMERAIFFDRLFREPTYLFLTGWGADYPDPDNFLRVALQRHQIKWRNEAYDRLVEEARRVIDQEERIKLYQQADRILVEEAPIISLTYEREHLLVKPWVSKFPTSAIKTWFWKDVILEPH